MDNRHSNIRNNLLFYANFIRPISLPKLFCTIFLLLIITLGACRRKTTSTSTSTKETDTSHEQTQTEAAVSQESAVKESVISKEQTKTEPNVSEEIITTEMSLFDGKSLGQWAITDFGGQGEVYVKDGAIYMEMGNDMTGINWKGPLIRMNYEITLEAMRVEGPDFFCGLTFPVGDKPCSLILGGWGGQVCGLSSLDYFDASQNETTKFIKFNKGR